MGTTRSVILSLVLTLGILVTPLAAHAQQAGKIPRVGVIANRAGYDAFREGLRDLAYKEGENIALRSEEHTSELQSLAYLVCRLLLEKKKKQKKEPLQST